MNTAKYKQPRGTLVRVFLRVLKFPCYDSTRERVGMATTGPGVREEVVHLDFSGGNCWTKEFLTPADSTMYFQLFLYNSRRPDIIFGHLGSENNVHISRESDWARRVHVTDQSIIINVTYGQPGTKLTTITNRLSSISMPNEMRIKDYTPTPPGWDMADDEAQVRQELLHSVSRVITNGSEFVAVADPVINPTTVNTFAENRKYFETLIRRSNHDHSVDMKRDVKHITTPGFIMDVGGRKGTMMQQNRTMSSNDITETYTEGGLVAPRLDCKYVQKAQIGLQSGDGWTHYQVPNPQIDNHKKREEEEDGGIIPQCVSVVCKCSQTWVSAMTSRVTGAGIALGLVAVLLWRATN